MPRNQWKGTDCLIFQITTALSSGTVITIHVAKDGHNHALATSTQQQFTPMIKGDTVMLEDEDGQIGEFEIVSPEQPFTIKAGPYSIAVNHAIILKIAAERLQKGN